MPTATKKTFRKFLIREFFLIHLAVIMVAGLSMDVPLHPKLTPINPLALVPLTLVLVYEVFLLASLLKFLESATGKRKRAVLLALLLPVLMLANITYGARGAYSRAYHSGFHELEDWRAAAEQGDGLAQYRLGMYNALNARNMDEAARWCLEAAAEGHDCDKLLGDSQREELHAAQAKFKKKP